MNRRVFLLLALVWLTQAVSAEPRLIHPVLAHAHNDYEHTHPLFDALAQNFDSVEADVHLVNGQLLVAHDRNHVQADRTLESLYLEPLVERVRANRGWVRKPGHPLVLLIDVKSEARATCRALQEHLAQYAWMLTTFGDDEIKTRAITVVVSGNRSAAVLEAESPRFTTLDGRIDELESTVAPGRMLWLSADWKAAFTWRGVGPMPTGEKEKLDRIVAQAHAHGRQLRFWDTPDRPEFWRTLCAAGVDIIGADDLAGLRNFLGSK